ncbi:MAG: metalloregulator ArsR/SmtB family transcription factor, partial [Anaerolineae bacterium]
EFAVTLPLMERSIAHHRLHNAGLAFRALFSSVTGRQVPERIAAELPGVRSVIFCPSCYVGPYVAYSRYRTEMVVFYNCRSTPPLPAVTGGTALYPPLKALADETRLQIVAMLRRREMYAQEIVDRLDISQPAVSRHLNLMATAGVLTIRREGNAKYYAVNQETLSRVADSIRRLA